MKIFLSLLSTVFSVYKIAKTLLYRQNRDLLIDLFRISKYWESGIPFLTP